MRRKFAIERLWIEIIQAGINIGIIIIILKLTYMCIIKSWMLHLSNNLFFVDIFYSWLYKYWQWFCLYLNRIIRSFVVFWKYINYLELLRIITTVIYVVKFDECCKKSLSLSAKPILIIFRLVAEKWHFDGKLLWRIFLCEILIKKLKYDKTICELRIF